MIRTSGRRKYRRTNSTQAAFLLTEQDYAVTHNSSGDYTGEATITDGTNQHTIFPMYGFRGVRLYPYGTGDNNGTVNYRVWGFSPDFSTANRLPGAPIGDISVGGIACLIADTSTFTLGTQVGIAGGLVGAAERYADTITMQLADTATTPDGPGSDHEGIYQLGTAGRYSAAANTKAHLAIPHIGDYWGFIVEGDITGVVTDWNWLVELTA